MANDTVITIIGNMVSDAELRFTPSGSAVANFTIASTPSSFDKNTNAFKDGETLFIRCSIWREAAENVAESLTKGMRVIAQGRLKSRTYDTKEGEKRTVMELEIDEIGPSMRYANAKVNRTQRSGQGGPNTGQHEAGTYSNQQGQQSPQGQGGWGGDQQQQGQSQNNWGNAPDNSEPPF